MLGKKVLWQKLFIISRNYLGSGNLIVSSAWIDVVKAPFSKGVLILFLYVYYWQHLVPMIDDVSGRRVFYLNFLVLKIYQSYMEHIAGTSWHSLVFYCRSSYATHCFEPETFYMVGWLCNFQHHTMPWLPPYSAAHLVALDF